MTVIIIIIGLVLGAVIWSWLYQILLDIKLELIKMNRELKSRKDKPWNYTMEELEAAIKHE